MENDEKTVVRDRIFVYTVLRIAAMFMAFLKQNFLYFPSSLDQLKQPLSHIDRLFFFGFSFDFVVSIRSEW